MTNTDHIFKTTAPYNNPWQQQERYQRLLFVCSAGLLRSATGATLYSKKGYNTRACGTHPYALIPLSANLISWADIIIFVNKENFEQATDTFEDNAWMLDHLRQKAQVLEIPDNHAYMDEELIRAFGKQLQDIV